LLDSCCGHFLCFVNHQDYILKPGYDPVLFKKEVLAYLKTPGAKYPAEHNVGHLYHASALRAVLIAHLFIGVTYPNFMGNGL
jgi:D-lactate dehydrogenase